MIPACNPQFAHQAIGGEPQIGALPWPNAAVSLVGMGIIGAGASISRS